MRGFNHLINRKMVKVSLNSKAIYAVEKHIKFLPNNKVVCSIKRRKKKLTAGIDQLFRGLNFFNAQNGQNTQLSAKI